MDTSKLEFLVAGNATSKTELSMDEGPNMSTGSDEVRMRKIEYDIVVLDRLREKLFKRRNRFSQ